MEKSVFLEKFLADELGLSSKEITLYINLMQYGALTILELSEISGINRATTHVNVENLTQKGLVTQVKKGRGSRRIIMAEPPEKLFAIFQERKTKLETATSKLNIITQELSSLKKEYRLNSGMEVRRYSGKNEVNLIYDSVLKAKEIRAYVNCKELSKAFPVNTIKFLETHKKRPDMHIWEILEDSKAARTYAKEMPAERYYVRLTTKNLDLASIDYIIFDGKIAVVELSSTTTVSGVVIENHNFHENAKAIHKFVWDSLPPYTR